MKRTYPHVKFGKYSFSDRKELFNYSFAFQIVKWAQLIRLQYIVIALNNLVGGAQVTIYSLTNRIPQMVPAYMNKLVAPFFPSYSKLIAEKKFNHLRELVLKLSKVIVRFSVFLSLAIATFNEVFIKLWVGLDKFGGEGMQFWLILYMLISSIFCGFGIIVYSTRKFEKWKLFSILEIFVVVILSISFWRFYGINGLIAGFVIGSMFSQFYVAYIALKQIEIKYSYLIAGILKYAALPNLISILCFIIIRFYITLSTWTNLILFATVFVILHLLPEIIRFVRSKEDILKVRIIKSFIP
nr:hypothetical protein [Pedobacter arcticus]